MTKVSTINNGLDCTNLLNDQPIDLQRQLYALIVPGMDPLQAEAELLGEDADE